MTDSKKSLDELHAHLGYKRLDRTWAMCEILLGLSAAGIGLIGVMTKGLVPIAGLILFVLGGYLTMAGHHSHLYQSNNELTAYLSDLIRSTNDKGKRE